MFEKIKTRLKEEFPVVSGNDAPIDCAYVKQIYKDYFDEHFRGAKRMTVEQRAKRMLAGRSQNMMMLSGITIVIFLFYFYQPAQAMIGKIIPNFMLVANVVSIFALLHMVAGEFSDFFTVRQQWKAVKRQIDYCEDEDRI